MSSYDRPLLMTSKELATYLKVNPSTVRNWTRKGAIPHIRIGGTIRFNLDHVLKHIAAQTR